MILKSLPDFGADVEASGIEGVTSLIYAARTDKASFAVFLLKCGADINAMSTLGQMASTIAIAYKSHNVLQLLLDRWFEYSVCPRLRGPHLLQIVALYADIETMKILTTTDRFELKNDKTNLADDFTTRLHERADANEKLIFAFEDLIRVLDREPEMRKGKQSLMESGLLLCAGFDQGSLTSEASSDHADSEQSFDDALHASLLPPRKSMIYTEMMLF
ncbi:hypothetical protein MMC21_001933 [Puttea exsequens]|nr:hypothetical protein [Puttea exsequens]